ncbi:MAG: hypothetical protein C0P77_012070 [Thermoanaerobacterales bacterium]|nr:hypothetical protein [Thermoanaerobacterales bacterium]
MPDHPDPPGAVPPRPARWPLALLGVLAVVALVASVVLVRGASSGDEALDPPGRSGSEEAADQEPATEEEIEAAVAEISAFVEQETGLSFVEPVTVELAGEGEFQDRLLADFDEDVEDLRTTEVVLEALGLVDPEVDVVEAMRSLLGGGVVGFYDPETDELVVRGAALTPYVRSTIAHELVHALDDQHHDLDRPEYDDRPDEISFGFSALVEGHARRIESAYLESLGDEAMADALAEELAIGTDIDFSGVPMVLFDLISAPYVLGEPFVDAVLADGGQEALVAAFADPPTTTEQVLDPDRYLAREAAIDVPTPTVPGEPVDEGMIGQLLVRLVLGEELDRDEARAAAEGWGGDMAVAWRDGERACVTATLVGDDVRETEELRQAFERWAAAQPDARVEPTGGGGPFTLVSCAA